MNEHCCLCFVFVISSLSLSLSLSLSCSVSIYLSIYYLSVYIHIYLCSPSASVLDSYVLLTCLYANILIYIYNCVFLFIIFVHLCVCVCRHVKQKLCLLNGSTWNSSSSPLLIRMFSNIC